MGRSVKSPLRFAAQASLESTAAVAESVGALADGRRRGRPSGRCATREGLVKAGMAIFAEQGYTSTGIDRVLREAGVPKGSFYHYFASKEEFGLAVIDAYGRLGGDELVRLFGDPAVAPLDRFGRFVLGAKRSMRKHGYRRGCLIGNFGQEFGCAHESFARRLVTVLEDWQRPVAGCLREAQAAGQIDPVVDPIRLAELFWIGWEGAVMRARLERSSRPLERFMEFYLARMRRL